MVGPKASRTPGKSRMMARAMMCAVECRRTSSASRSLGVRIRSSIGRRRRRSRADDRGRRPGRRPTAATAASASRLPIPAATSRGLTPSGYSLTEPSGSLIWTIAGHSPNGLITLNTFNLLNRYAKTSVRNLQSGIWHLESGS